VILVVSDLHIGRNRHEGWKQAFALMKDREWSKIFILGDLFDLWQRPETTMVDSTLAALSELKADVVYTVGNHDEGVIKEIGYWDHKVHICPHYTEEIAGLRFRFCHGHMADRFYTCHGVLSRVVTRVEAVVHSLFRVDIQQIARRLAGLFIDNKRRTIHRLIVEQNWDADVVISGHTHLPGAYSISGVSYVNSGDWVHNMTYVVIDEASGMCSVCRVGCPDHGKVGS